MAATAALAAVVVVSASAGSAAKPQLVGTVGPGYTIKLTLNGSKVKSANAGKYLLVVHDKGRFHNFVFEKAKGGTFEKTVTGVGFVGTRTLNVKLTPGKWEFYCRVHESTMKGELTVS
jgi:plastocyanin